VTKNRVAASSAASHLALLEEKDAALQSAALRRLNLLVDEFWPEIYESIEVMSERYSKRKRKNKNIFFFFFFLSLSPFTIQINNH
jgi:26S proteasome regulatory subunit N2